MVVGETNLPLPLGGSRPPRPRRGDHPRGSRLIKASIQYSLDNREGPAYALATPATATRARDKFVSMYVKSGQGIRRDGREAVRTLLSRGRGGLIPHSRVDLG